MEIVEVTKSLQLMLANEKSGIEINQELEKKHKIWALKLEGPHKKRKEDKNKDKQNLPYLSSWISIGKTKNRSYKVSFQEALKVTLTIGQCIGLMPLIGITNENCNNLRFTRKSWIYFLSAFYLTIQIIVTTLCVVRLFRVPVSFGIVSFVLFYGGTATTTCLFMRISKKWPELMKEVSRNEKADPNKDRYVKLKCTAATVIILSLALIEHILSSISTLATILDCTPENDQIYKAFIAHTFPWLSELVDIDSLFLRISLQVMNVQDVLNWNFSDLFIICVSFYLVSRLDQMNRRLNASRGKYLPTSSWRKLREDYNSVTRLIRNFDEVINGIIFVSFASNLYFICLQLFNTLSTGLRFNFCITTEHNGPFHGHEPTIYYLFSLLFLLARSLTVSLVAASVHSTSLLAAPALYDVPSPVYSIEVQRFLEQLHGETVALTGLRFFKVTRGLVLSVAGTIVTYELVLLQFNRDDIDDSVDSRSNISLEIS